MKTEGNEPIGILPHAPNGQPQYKSDMPHIEGQGTLIGLTKREYFAAIAMQGILANSDADICEKTTVNGGWLHPETVAKISVQIGDALIAELNKQV